MCMKLVPTVARWGEQYHSSTGWVAQLGKGVFSHRFGGSDWMGDSDDPSQRAAQLLTLDLRDPVLSAIDKSVLNELALCSCINSTACYGLQVFQIDLENHQVNLVRVSVETPEPIPVADQFPIPLASKALALRPMHANELPTAEEEYWDACDGFVGGSSPIRVLGPALWLQHVEHHTCFCGRDMVYLASIGYENYGSPAGYLDRAPLFFGEFAQYFFYCQRCLRYHVSSQST
jgi:hypothetical protein